MGMNKKSRDLLMVFPSGGDLYFTNFKHHLGSAYIIAYLREHRFTAEQFISDESYNVKECVKKIAKYNPKIVGFTVYETNFMQCALLSNGIKAFNSDIIIIFGGPTPSVQSKEILESIRSVDICVRREGEETLLELLTNITKSNFNLNQVDLDKIKGITFRREKNIIITPERNALLSNKSINNFLDKYPSPYLSKVIPISKAFPMGIITARGCNQNCTYCNCAVISKKNIFFHSIERVIEELVYINESKKFIVPVPINDDSFTILPIRATKICEAIIENDIKIPLICTTRCDKITEDLLDLMKQAGFVSIGFSLESAVPRILKTIGKVSPPELKEAQNFEKEIGFIQKLKYMTSYAKKIGFDKVFVSIMVGLPGESIEDAKKTIDFINKLDIDFYTHNIFHIFKGTPIYQNYEDYGYKIKPMGEKNKILIKNSFPFDVYKIKLAPKCARIQNDEVIDYDVLKILSLSTKRTKKKPFFDNIIINSNTLKPSIVKWIQKNQAINGAIIHIYSDIFKYLKFHEKNEITLFNEFSPTSFYESYFWDNSTDTLILKAGRMALYNEEFGLPIKSKDTHLVFEDYEKGANNMQYLISIDRAPIDTKALYNILIKISKKENMYNYFLNSNPLPQFQQLCRWTKNQANCQTLETAIIENDDSIRICWFSDSIGKVGISISDIIQKLESLNKEREVKRTCNLCQEKESCVKCLFPYPLPSEKYCEYKRNSFTNKSADLIYAFSVVKDFIFRPINPLEF